MMKETSLYSVKMRASKDGRHVSGAERIVGQEDIGGVVQALAQRALQHGLGRADFINLKLEEVQKEELLTLPALPVSQEPADTVEEAYAIMRARLAEVGVKEADALVELVRSVHPMRGAVLYDVATGRRVEPDRQRGIRVTYMDAANNTAPANGKNHFHEAVVLATKVVNAPGILAELCVSDDPDYVVGYIASKKHGYVRLMPLKKIGDRHGGRVFVYDSRLAKIEDTIAFLEKKRVLVENVPQARSRAGCDIVGSGAEARPQEQYEAELARLRNQKLYRSLRTMESEQAKYVRLQGEKTLMLASNSYLDLAADARVKQAAADAALQWGAGSGGSRLTTGNTGLHEQLEQELARFKQTEAALLFNTGYMANVGVISALVHKGGCIFSDEYNHASIIDGCRLSGGKIIVYRHNDMADLEDKLRRYPCDNGLIVSDAVFSMDGDIVNLPELVRLGKKYSVLTMIDEAHATGVIGASGRGAAEHFGCCPPDIIMGTLSKALGSEGGFVCADRGIIDYLLNKARSYIFSTAQCPAALGAALAGLRILQAEPQRVQRLQHNVEIFCRCLKEQDVDAASPTAIIPIMIGDEEKALRVAQQLAERHILIPAIRYPTVAKGTARLRAALMATHTPEELQEAARQIAQVIKSC